jgi:homospermidine synthase
MAGVVWVMKNPACDVIEADDLPHDEMLRLTLPYLGEVIGAYSDWTPLQGRSWLFEEDIDAHDPWQFKNFRVT